MDLQRNFHFESLILKYKAMKPEEQNKLNDDMKFTCHIYLDSQKYKSTDKTDVMYRLCCETLDYCAFYKQTWFYLAIAGGVILIVIVGIVISCCCCRKGRGGGGRDEKAIESIESIETTTADKTDDE